MKKKYDDLTITFTLTKAGCREGAPVTLTGAEFNNLAARLSSRRPKPRPLTKGQAQTAELFVDFVRGGMDRK